MSSLTLPFDLASQQEDLDRKKQIATLLQQTGLQPQQGQMISGHYVAPGPLSAISQLAQSYIGSKLADTNKQQQADLTARYNDTLAKGLEKYFFTREGRPGEVLSDEQAGNLLNNDISPTLADPIKANPRRAAIEALTSGVGPLQQLGQSDLASMGKQTLTPKDILGLAGENKFDPKSALVAALTGDLTKLSPNGKDQWSEPYEMNIGGRKVLVKRNSNTNEVKPIEAGPSVTVNTGDAAGAAFSKALGGRKAEDISKSFEGAKTAVAAMDTLAQAGDDLDSGIKSGAPAKVSLALAKWGKALGLSDDPAVVNTESYRANMARETAQMVKNFGSGTGISNADREFAERAAGGDITLDDASMSRLLNIAKAATANVVMRHNSLIDSALRTPGGAEAGVDMYRLPFNFQANDQIYFDPSARSFRVKGSPKAQPRVPYPPASSAPTAPGVISFQEWLGQ